MSDKNTAAQSELPTGDELRALAKRASTSASDGASASELVLAGWKAAVAKIRASEGQAQTSAATWINEAVRIFGSARLTMNWPDVESMLKKMEESGKVLAAQLADSTAPGAPESLQPVNDPLTERKTADIISRGYEKVGYVLQNEAGEYCLSAQSAVRWLKQPEYWRLMHEQDGSLFAATTAQQSLTAGGAVPKWEDLMPYEDKPTGKQYELMEAEIKAHRALAAAPLPQVQSEALDAARYALNNAPSLYALGFNVAHARSCTNGIDETGVGSDEYEAAADDVRGAIRKARDLIRSALAQQAIKPSVDNDGGVKS